jgi:hypothetical protein
MFGYGVRHPKKTHSILGGQYMKNYKVIPVKGKLVILCYDGLYEGGVRGD